MRLADFAFDAVRLADFAGAELGVRMLDPKTSRVRNTECAILRELPLAEMHHSYTGDNTMGCIVGKPEYGLEEKEPFAIDCAGQRYESSRWRTSQEVWYS